MWNRLAYFRRKSREARTRISFHLVIFSNAARFSWGSSAYSYSLFLRIWNLWKRLHISYAQPTTKRPLCQEVRAGFSFFHNPVFPGLYILSIIRLAPPGKLQFRLSAQENWNHAYQASSAARQIGVCKDASQITCHCEPVRLSGVAIPRLERKCIDNCPTARGSVAIIGGNRYLVPFNRGIATPVCALARNDSFIFKQQFIGFPILADKQYQHMKTGLSF